MYHYRKSKNTYEELNKADKQATGCRFPFCNKENLQPIIDENETMAVTPNRVKYDLFEGRRVIDHLMIIPKRHVETLSEFTARELQDFGELAGKYEAQGYNIYARAVGSVNRSVKHQHTHLIKCDDQRHKLFIASDKPYFVIHV